MTRIKKPFKFIYRKVSRPLKWLRLLVKQQFGLLDVPSIILYRGYGNRENVFIRGAVTEDKGLQKPNRKDSMWVNMKSMIARYTADSIPGVRISVKYNEHELKLESDENGQFGITFPGVNGEHSTSKVNAQIVDKIEGAPDKRIKTSEDVLLPGQDSEFGVISDIDDTIMISHATQTLKKLRLMLLKNAITRKPFPGVTAFYQALHRGASGSANNPFFYVSSSEWNLYDLLDDFVDDNKLPRGVFLLQDLNHSIFKFWKSGGGTHEHKLVKIRRILKTFDKLSFVLIGDSGQRDPKLYKAIVDEFPGRIKAVYIRHIKKGLKERYLNDLIKQFKEKNVDMLLVKNTYEAAVHAIDNKLIGYDWLKNIDKEMRADEDNPNLFEGLVNYVEDSQRQSK